MRFKQFEIRKPNLLCQPSTEDYYKYNFDLVKWADDNSYCWSIGFLTYNHIELCFEFASVGTRYLEDREDGLEEWLLKWCELKETEYRYEEKDY